MRFIKQEGELGWSLPARQQNHLPQVIGQFSILVCSLSESHDSLQTLNDHESHS